MDKRKLIAIGIVTVVGLAAGLTLWLYTKPSAVPISSESAQKLPPLTTEQAAQLSADLKSGDEKRVRNALDSPDNQAFETGFIEDLSSFGSISIDVLTFQFGATRNDVGTVQVDVIDTAGVKARWTFYLVAVDGRWKISETIQE